VFGGWGGIKKRSRYVLLSIDSVLLFFVSNHSWVGGRVPNPTGLGTQTRHEAPLPPLFTSEPSRQETPETPTPRAPTSLHFAQRALPRRASPANQNGLFGPSKKRPKRSVFAFARLRASPFDLKLGTLAATNTIVGRPFPVAQTRHHSPQKTGVGAENGSDRIRPPRQGSQSRYSSLLEQQINPISQKIGLICCSKL